MYKLDHKHYVMAVGLYLLATIAVLWSWNTLPELFNLPAAQYKHVLAATTLLLVFKFSVCGNHRISHHFSGGRDEDSNH